MAVILLAVLLGRQGGGQTAVAAQPEQSRPNIVLIISDDQRYDTMQYMPLTTERLFNQGLSFERAYVTTSRCCPSRASILTGMYAHTHNVRVNTDPLPETTFVEHLAAAGYRTGLVGKYLNSYPTRESDPPRSEFDTWVNMLSGPQNALYYNPRLNINGTWQAHTGYQTDILREYAVRFLQDAATDERPFLLIFAPYAPHLPALPAPGDETLFLDEPPYRPPNFNPDQLTGKPEWMQWLPRLTADEIARIDAERLRQNQSLAALDRAVDTLLATLEAEGELENTAVIYLSDNGFFWGEHRLPTGKIFVYEPSTRIPMAIRYPPRVAAGKVSEQLVANIDIAPTIYDLAGLPIPAGVDGRSLRPLFDQGEAPDWRTFLLLEGWPVDISTIQFAPPWQAVHNGRFVYVETEWNRSELYDLETDPYQLTNLVDDPAYTAVQQTLQQQLAQARTEIGPAPEGSGATAGIIRQARFRMAVQRLWLRPLVGPLRLGHVLLSITLVGLGLLWRRRRMWGR